jgi:hypothetical protein
MSDLEEGKENRSLSLLNLDNYNSIYSHSVSNVYEIFSSLLINFLENSKKTIYIKEQNYMHYVIENGINIIKNIFSIIYLYTKNLELTKQYTEKGYYIYCEFIGKVGDSNHKFLNLNAKDATLFVLKKTIYEINNTFKRNFKLSCDEKNYINQVEKINNLFTNIIIILLSANKTINLKYIDCEHIKNSNNIQIIPLHIMELLKKKLLDHYNINNVNNANNANDKYNNIVQHIRNKIDVLSTLFDENTCNDEKIKKLFHIINHNCEDMNENIYNDESKKEIYDNIYKFIVN